MPCECETLRRRDEIGREIGRSDAGGNVRRVTARSAGAPLRYYREGVEQVEYAAAGDLGEIQIGSPVEIYHGGPVVGAVVAIARTDSELVCDIQITDGAALARVDLPPGDPNALPHVSADYTISRIDADGTQRGVVIRALALVPRGRCGDACSVSRRDAFEPCYAFEVTTIKIGSKEYAAGSAEAAAAMVAEFARLDAAGARIRAEESKALRARVETAFGLKLRADALDPEILISAVKKVAPGVDLNGQSDDFIAGAFAVAIAMALEIKGAAGEPGPDDAPAPGADAAPKPPAPPGGPPRADGASALRADVFIGREADAKAPKPASLPTVPRDIAARNGMIKRSGQPATGAVRTVR